MKRAFVFIAGATLTPFGNGFTMLGFALIAAVITTQFAIENERAKR